MFGTQKPDKECMYFKMLLVMRKSRGGILACFLLGQKGTSQMDGEERAITLGVVA